MANRMKEDEKNERIIRGLLKLPGNRRCINCNNLGPQYVCTNFWTFICTNCSGIHREFTHRVKSVSMAKFTTQEVIALKEGGNERAKEIYFKEWDTQRQSLPDVSNIDRVRDFIKHVYVDRRYTGEKNVDRPPRAKQGDGDDSSENRSVDSYRGGSRSPPYDDQYSERAGYGGRSVPRSPGYDGGDKRSPVRFEAVDEKRQDDRFGNGNQNRRFEERAFSDGVPKQGRSPIHQKEIDTSSPPMVRPVRDILGDDVPALRIGPPPKSSGMRIPDSQRTSSSSSMGSSDGSVQQKGASSGSLIDFDADPEPPAVPAAANQSVPQQTTSEPTDGANWASFDFNSQQIAPQVAANATTLESMLGQLSAPGSAPGGNTSTLPLSGFDSFPKIDNGVRTMQQQRPSVPPASNNQFVNALFTAPSVGAVNQPWGSPSATNFEAALTVPTGYPSQVAPKPPQEMNVSVPSQPTVEAKPVGRKAFPEDLFASLYPLTPTSVPGWQGRPHPGMGYGMGYGMQYPTGVTMATFPPPSKPSNPFDFMNEPASVQAAMFPSVASLQEALPNLARPSLLHTTNSGIPSHWMPPQQLPYPSAVSQSPYMMQQVPSNMPQQLPNNTTQMGTYMMQQVPSNMPQQLPNNTTQMAHQGVRGPGVEGAFFGAYGMDQHFSPRYSQPGNSNSVGGNPFG